MSKIIIALILICSFESTIATYMVFPDSVFDHCPNINYLENIDKNKILGTWYLYGAIIREESDLSDLVTDCSIMTRSKMKKRTKKAKIGKQFVVGTDYINYLIQMNCEMTNNYNSYQFMIRIFTRKDNPSSDVIRYTVEALSQSDVAIASFHKTAGRKYCVTFK